MRIAILDLGYIFSDDCYSINGFEAYVGISVVIKLDEHLSKRELRHVPIVRPSI
jgi:hypothetical protein